MHAVRSGGVRHVPGGMGRRSPGREWMVSGFAGGSAEISSGPGNLIMSMPLQTRYRRTEVQGNGICTAGAGNVNATTGEPGAKKAPRAVVESRVPVILISLPMVMNIFYSSNRDWPALQHTTIR